MRMFLQLRQYHSEFFLEYEMFQMKALEIIKHTQSVQQLFN